MHPAEILWTVAIGFVLVGSVGWFLTVYNTLVEMKNNIGRSWANIDVLLKQRHDELPKLVSTCEAYMQHERAVFDKLSEARSAVATARTVGQRAEAEGRIGRALGGFMAVAENYPDLKANQNYLALQEELTGTESKIAYARQFYNDQVAKLNTLTQKFPASVIAARRHFEPRPFFDIEEPVRGPVQVDL